MDEKSIELASQLITHLTRDEFVQATEHFDATVKALLPAERLQTTWQKLESQMGPFQRREEARTALVQGHLATFVPCVFERGRLELIIAVNEAGQISGLTLNPLARQPEQAAPQDLPAYIRQDAFREVEVLVGQGEWSLPGTLTLPQGEGPFPAVVLVHGSGPQDRDETIGPNKPFRDLAWGLASRQIAVLRYEKRTHAYKEKLTQESLHSLTVREETIDDALAAVRLLRESPLVDARSLFMLGHSLGGYLLPRIATQETDLAGLIVLAGSTRPLEDIILDQVGYIFSTQGEILPEQQRQLEELKQRVARVKAPDLALDTPTSELPLGVEPVYWLDLRDYHPAELARHLLQPMLILQAECDYQVTMQDFQGWKEGLKARRDVTFKSYPGLYHSFLRTPDGKMATPTIYAIPGHIDAEVIADIARWIEETAAWRHA